MAGRARRSRQREDETLQLEQVLEPYDDQQLYAQQFQYDDNVAYDQEINNQLYEQVEYEPYPEAGYADYLAQDAYEDGEEEPETRFGLAVHAFDMISSLIGVFVILILVAMLLTLIDWLRTDIFHSLLMLQSGIS